MKKYMIISSIVKSKDYIDFDKQSKIIKNEQFFCKQFGIEELKNLKEDDFVEGIKELSLFVLEYRHKFNFIKINKN